MKSRECAGYFSNSGDLTLLDFNAARFYNGSGGEDTVLLGTRGYAAPEQFGFGESVPQTDIYAVGVLLREPVSVCAQPAPHLEKITARCMQLNPQDRYPSAAALRDALTGVPQNVPCAKGLYARKAFLPPGFRTGNIWKMLFALLGYAFILYFSLSTDFERVFGAAETAERVFSLIAFLYLIFATCNYCNMQRIMPLCKSRKLPLKIIGVILLDVIGFVLILYLMAAVEMQLPGYMPPAGK